LNEQILDLHPGITAGTLHGYMLSLARLQPQPDSPSGFWENDLPNEAIDKVLLTQGGEYAFDELIVDEAQDILTNGAYLDFLDLILIGGLSSGRWRLFGDFENQAIRGDGRRRIDETLDHRLGNPPRYSLRVNCRNAPRIAELIHLLGGLVPGYSGIRRADNSIEPEIKLYKSKSHQVKLLSTAIKALRDEGFASEDVVVLSPRAGSSSAAGELARIAPDGLSELRLEASSHQVGYATIHAFKGLEAPAIIITDIEKVDTPLARALLYVGISRALDRLFILASEESRQGLLGIIAGSSPA
jgi:hypothetical protein